eukprot:scaffold2709_cov215-Skeletonema_marinoi.AAC.7
MDYAWCVAGNAIMQQWVWVGGESPTHLLHQSFLLRDGQSPPRYFFISIDPPHSPTSSASSNI